MGGGGGLDEDDEGDGGVGDDGGWRLFTSAGESFAEEILGITALANKFFL